VREKLRFLCGAGTATDARSMRSTEIFAGLLLKRTKKLMSL
jgi:hypothetical protein